ncbi:TauD/TfdA family dioxygenase [Streptomyces cupreus]|uniref:TauD/TfdA family dioxygenase n=1 Tax=Streptomyces cupreus TaxID=2759956 RepID=UPI00300D0C92
MTNQQSRIGWARTRVEPLAELLRRTTGESYVYSHRWGQGDVVGWDNFATLHTALPCDSTCHQRLLYRTSIP